METVISHYVRVNINKEIDSVGKFEIFLVEETFDLGNYIRAQIEWALKCPYNNNGLRERHGWSDEELKRQLSASPGIALNYFIEMHGDTWFRDNLKPKFIKTKAVKIDVINPGCFLSVIDQGCKKCAECLISKQGIVP